MKEKFKKLAVALMSFLLCILMAGCGSSAKAEKKASSGPVTVKFWHSCTGTNKEALDKSVKAYNASQDKVKVVATFQGTYDEMLSKLKEAVAADNGPDIAMINYAYIGDFYTSDVLEDLSPYLKKADIKKSDFAKGLMLNSYYKKKLLSIPFNRSTPLLHINKSALDEAGLSIPATWDDFNKVANALVKKDGNKVTRYGSVMQRDSFYPISMLNQYKNGSFYSKNGTGNDFGFIDNGVGSKVFTELKSLQNSGALYFTPAASSYEITIQTFLKQQAPMAFLTTAACNAIESANPSFDYTTAFLPCGDEKSVVTGGGNLAMFSSSKHKDEAGDFLSWFTKDEDGAAAFTITTGYLPYTKSMLELPAYKKLFSEKPYRKNAFDQLQYVEDTTHNVKHAAVLAEFYSAIEAIMYDNEDIDKTLANFEKEGKSILNE